MAPSPPSEIPPLSPAPSDEALETRWKTGDRAAFSELFERYYTRVFAFALRLLSDRSAAEDLAQQAFLNLYEKPPRRSSAAAPASFRTLVFTVVRNLALNELKRRGRRPHAPLELLGPGPGQSPPDPSGFVAPPEPFADAERREGQARLALALSSLAPDEREIVVLREVEELTFREVCQITGLSRDAVRWRLARGLEQLRLALIDPVEARP